MRSGLGVSILLHMLVVVIGYFGLPMLKRDVMMEAPVMVDIVMVSDLTNAPAPEVRKKAKPEPEKKAEEPKPEPKKAPPIVQTKAEPAPPSPPPPPPAPSVPEPEVAVVAPMPDPKPKAKIMPKPEPKPEPKPKAPEKPKSSAALTKARPAKKPKPPKPVDAFASVLKTVEQLKSKPRVEEKPKEAEKKKPEESFAELIAKGLVSKTPTFDASKQISISEIDFVRQQIRKCWLVQAGAKGAENINIEIAVNMNVDGTVRDARVNNKGLETDPFLRTMAESALRAVLNKRCQPFQLPRDRYESWQTMTLNFNPKEMFGE